MNTRVAGSCLSHNKDTVQISDELPANAAVDDDVNTHSCTLNSASFPWWFVDLGQRYSIGRVTVTWPNVGGDARNYRLSCCFHLLTNSQGTGYRE